MKRFFRSLGLTAFVAVLLLFSAAAWLCPASPAFAEAIYSPDEGFADSGTTSDGLTWAFYPDGTLVINGTGAMKDYSSGGPWKTYNSQIRKLVVSEGVTVIGEYAFTDTSVLTEVSLPSTLRRIETGAFQRSGIERLTLSSETMTIESSVFFNSALTSFTFDGGTLNTEFQAFYRCPELYSVDLSEADELILDSAMFRDCTALEYVSLPATITEIPASMFDGCTSLRGIGGIQNLTSLQTIGDYAFADCTALNFGYSYWPNSIQTIGKHAFQGCTSLVGFAVTSSQSQLALIDDSAFYGCTALEYARVDGDSHLKTVGDCAFMGCTALEEICLGYYTIESIGASAFADCTSLTDISIMDLGYTVKEIGQNCFARSGVTRIALPGSVAVIPSGTFQNCSSLTKVDLGDATTRIGDYAFDGCIALADFDMPDTVTVIGNYAFQNCRSLVLSADSGSSFGKFNLPPALTDMGEGALKNANAGYLHIPDTLTILRDQALVGATGYIYLGDSIELIIGAPFTILADGSTEWPVCAEPGTKTAEAMGEAGIPYRIYLAPGKHITFMGNTLTACDDYKTVVIPEGVTAIADDAFSGNESLTKLTLPETLGSIGARAFTDCTGLTSVVIPGSVASIGSGAFEGCTGLVAEVYKDSYAHTWCEDNSVRYRLIVEIIASGECGATDEDDVFWQLDEEGCLALYGTGAMKDYAGSDMPWSNYTDQIVSVVIKEGVTSVGSCAFKKAEALSEVSIAPSVKAIGYEAFYDCSSLIHAVIPEGTESIGARAFYRCTALTGVSLPDSLISVGASAFNECAQLTFVLPDNISSVGSYAFDNTAAIYARTGSTTAKCIDRAYTDADHPDWQYIYTRDTDGSVHLRLLAYTGEESELTIRADVEELNPQSGYVFPKTVLKVVLPDNIRSVSGAAQSASARFYAYVGTLTARSLGAAGYSFIDLSGTDFALIYATNSSTGKEYLAVAGYYGSDTEITLPAEATSVYSGAFGSNSPVKLIHLPDDIDYFFWNAFNVNISLSCSKDSATAHALSNMSYPMKFIDADDPDWTYCYENSDTEGHLLTAVRYNGSDTEVSVPAGVKLMNQTFKGNTAVTRVIVPEGVTELDNGVFADCTALTEVQLPDSLTTIGYENFAGCTSLGSLILPDNITSMFGVEMNTPDNGLTPILRGNFAWATDLYCSRNSSTAKVLFRAHGRSFFDIDNPDWSYCWMRGDDGGWALYLQKYVGEEKHIVLPEYVSHVTVSGAFTSMTLHDNVVFISGYYGSESQYFICSPGSAAAGLIIAQNQPFVESDQPDYLILYGTDEEGNATKTIQAYMGEGGELVIPEGVTHLKAQIFRNNTAITSAVIPGTVKEIPDECFNGCTALTTITLSEGVESIGRFAFYHCASLNGLVLPDTIRSLGADNTFNGCSALTEIVIPEGVTVLPMQIFSGCTGLERITLPATLTTIERNAFLNCSNLTEVYASSLERWMNLEIDSTQTDSHPMYYAKHLYIGGELLTELIVPEGIEIIGSKEFMNCIDMTSVILPGSVKSIDAYAFQNCANLTAVTLSEGLESIGAHAFGNCSSLTEIDFPASLQSIGEYAFGGCRSMVRFVLPEGIKTINAGVFPSRNLEELILPDNIATISRYSDLGRFEKIFCGRNTMTAHTLSAFFYDLGGYRTDDGFYDPEYPDVLLYWRDETETPVLICHGAYNASLENGEYTVPEDVTALSTLYFGYNARVHLPGGITQMPAGTGSEYTYLICEADSVTEATLQANGVLYARSPAPDCLLHKEADTGTLVLNKYVGAESEVIVPEGVTAIGAGAFGGNTAVNSVILPSTLTEIRNGAFNKSGIAGKLVIPEGVTAIGEKAFYYCGSLTGVDFPDTLVSIGSEAFFYANLLEGDIRMPAGLRTVGEKAFTASGVNFIFSEGLESIGVEAFGNPNDMRGSLIVCDLFSDTAKLLDSRRYHITDIDDRDWQYTFWPIDSVDQLTLSKYLGDEAVVTLPTKTAYVYTAFSSNKSVTEVIVPEGITHLLGSTFYGCTSLTKVTLPDSLTYMGGNMFDYSGLTSIVLPDNLTDIGAMSLNALYCNPESTTARTVSVKKPFYDVNAADMQYRYVTDDEGVERLAFTGYTGTESSVTLHEATEALNVYIGSSSSVTRICLPDGIEAIVSLSVPDKAVLLCEADTATEETLAVNGYSFAYPSDPDFVWKQGDNGLTLVKYCGSETVIAIPEYAVAIGEEVFYNAAVTGVTFPDSLKSIGSRAFAYCNDLTEITIPSGITDIGSGAFYSCHLENVYVESLDSWLALSFADTTSNPANGAQNVYIEGKRLGELVIPEHIDSIGAYAFCGCDSLTDITVLSDEITFGDQSFNSCYNLKRLALPQGNEPVMGSGVFSQTLTVYCPESTLADFWAMENGYSVIYLDDTANFSLALPEDCRMICGESMPIELRVYPALPDMEIVWTSSAPEVISVENGVATAHSVGKATITAAYGEASDSMVINAYAIAESFELSESEIWMVSKESKQLTIEKLLPEGASAEFVWESSDTNHLTVTDGLIYAKVPGDAVVTVTSDNGIVRTCTVHVCSKVTAIELETSELTITDDDTAQLIAKVFVTGDSFINKLVSFASSDPSIADVDANGLITALAPGKCEIIVSSSSGKSAVCCVTVLCSKHSEVVDEAAAPTCTEKGLTEGKHCSVCGEVLIAQEEVPALGHNISVDEAVYEANVGDEIKIHGSILCGHEETIELNWVSGDDDVAGFVDCSVNSENPRCFEATFVAGEAGVAVITAEFADGSAAEGVCTMIVHSDVRMRLPAFLKLIEEEAFADSKALEYVMPEGVEIIGTRAFAGNRQLILINLPRSIKHIEAEAFKDCEMLTIVCEENSVGHQYAERFGIPCVVLQEDAEDFQNAGTGE